MEAAGDIVRPNHDSVAARVLAVNVLEAAHEMVRIWPGASEEILGIRHGISVQIVGPGQRYFKDPKAEQWRNQISRQVGAEP